MTKQDFGRLIMVIRGVYRDKEFLADDESAAVWYELLKDLTYEQAKAAVMRHALTNKWAPSIAELREQVVSIQIDKVDWSDGWQEVMTAIRRHGYVDEAGALEAMSPMTREIVKRLGWKQICQSEQDELMALRANFRMIYQQKHDDVQEELQLPPGFMKKAKAIIEGNTKFLEQDSSFTTEKRVVGIVVEENDFEDGRFVAGEGEA